MTGNKCLFLLAVAFLVAMGPSRSAYGDEGSPYSQETLKVFSTNDDNEVYVSIDVNLPYAVALQFELEYDPEELELRAATPAAPTEVMEKSFEACHITSGVARVFVFGHNMERLPRGTLGEVLFHKVGNADEPTVRVVRRQAVDAKGRTRPTRVRDGRIVSARPYLKGVTP